MLPVAVFALVILGVIGIASAVAVIVDSYRDGVPVQCSRIGFTADGAVWQALRLDANTLRLERDGRVWVTACGPETLVTLTVRYAIAWA